MSPIGIDKPTIYIPKIIIAQRKPNIRIPELQISFRRKKKETQMS